MILPIYCCSDYFLDEDFLRCCEECPNVEERGLSFELAADFDWTTALAEEDARKDYGERRVRALGFVGRRLHVLVFTMRQDTMHVISFRKVNPREVRRHGQAKS